MFTVPVCQILVISFTGKEALCLGWHHKVFIYRVKCLCLRWVVWLADPFFFLKNKTKPLVAPVALHLNPAVLSRAPLPCRSLLYSAPLFPCRGLLYHVPSLSCCGYPPICSPSTLPRSLFSYALPQPYNPTAASSIPLPPLPSCGCPCPATDAPLPRSPSTLPSHNGNQRSVVFFFCCEVGSDCNGPDMAIS